MAAAQPVTEERAPGSGYTHARLESAERPATRIVDVQLQRLVERAAALVSAPRASLALLDPASQAVTTAAAFSKSFNGPRPANLRVHEDVARWVIEHRAPAIISDFAADQRARALGMIAVGSLLSVPLLSGQQALGALTLSTPLINAFRPLHLRLLEMVADLAALAVAQARQIDAVAQQTQHLTMLLEVSRGLGTLPDLRTTLSLTISTIRRLVSCEEALIFRYDASTQMLCGVAGVGAQSSRLTEWRVRLSDQQSVAAWVAQQRRPLLHTTGANGFVGQATETLLAQREMALLAVPLVARERLQGVILLARSSPFDTGELRTMLMLGQMVAHALAQSERAG